MFPASPLVLFCTAAHVCLLQVHRVSHSALDYFLHLGLTDEEVELAIQRSGSVEETLALSPSGPPHIVHGPALAPAPYSESYSTSHDKLLA